MDEACVISCLEWKAFMFCPCIITGVNKGLTSFWACVCARGSSGCLLHCFSVVCKCSSGNPTLRESLFGEQRAHCMLSEEQKGWSKRAQNAHCMKGRRGINPHFTSACHFYKCSFDVSSNSSPSLPLSVLTLPQPVITVRLLQRNLHNFSVDLFFSLIFLQ